MQPPRDQVAMLAQIVRIELREAREVIGMRGMSHDGLRCGRFCDVVPVMRVVSVASPRADVAARARYPAGLDHCPAIARRAQPGRSDDGAARSLRLSWSCALLIRLVNRSATERRLPRF